MEAGCEVLMPWTAPIGTGQGPRNPRALGEPRERAPHISMIVDAGSGLPSHACRWWSGDSKVCCWILPFHVRLTQSEWRPPLRRLSGLGLALFGAGQWPFKIWLYPALLKSVALSFPIVHRNCLQLLDEARSWRFYDPAKAERYRCGIGL